MTGNGTDGDFTVLDVPTLNRYFREYYLEGDPLRHGHGGPVARRAHRQRNGPRPLQAPGKQRHMRWILAPSVDHVLDGRAAVDDRQWDVYWTTLATAQYWISI
jgi:hypothetical protein